MPSSETVREEVSGVIIPLFPSDEKIKQIIVATIAVITVSSKNFLKNDFMFTSHLNL